MRPADDAFFAKCCETAACDLISIDLTSRGNWGSLTFANVAKAIARGVFLEVYCAPAFGKNANDKANFFSTVMKLVSVCRGKNIVFSQHASDWDEVRGPQDVMNMGVMCGLSLEQAHNAVGEWVRQCIVRGATRARTYRSVVSVQLEDASNSKSLIDDAADMSGVVVAVAEPSAKKQKGAAEDDDEEDVEAKWRKKKEQKKLKKEKKKQKQQHKKNKQSQ